MRMLPVGHKDVVYHTLSKNKSNLNFLVQTYSKKIVADVLQCDFGPMTPPRPWVGGLSR